MAKYIMVAAHRWMFTSTRKTCRYPTKLQAVLAGSMSTRYRAVCVLCTCLQVRTECDCFTSDLLCASVKQYTVFLYQNTINQGNIFGSAVSQSCFWTFCDWRRRGRMSAGKKRGSKQSDSDAAASSAVRSRRTLCLLYRYLIANIFWVVCTWYVMSSLSNKTYKIENTCTVFVCVHPLNGFLQVIQETAWRKRQVDFH